MESKCFVSAGDSQALVDAMISYLEDISYQSYSLLSERFRDIFEQLDDIEKNTARKRR